jgi:hypothetical protein
VWRRDPTTGKVTPCDPPPTNPERSREAAESKGTPVARGTPSLLFGDLGSVLQRSATACPSIYDAAMTAQTFSSGDSAASPWDSVASLWDKQFEVYVGSDPNGGRPQIFVLDHQTNTNKMVTRFGSGVSYDPVFAPDGYRIAFISQEQGPDNLYTVTRDGTDVRRLTRLPGQDWTTTWEWLKRPTWSVDGTQIAFWSNRVSGARQIWVVNTDGSNLYSISNDPRPSEDWAPVWAR